MVAQTASKLTLREYRRFCETAEVTVTAVLLVEVVSASTAIQDYREKENFVPL